jgi:hypothetical protein
VGTIVESTSLAVSAPNILVSPIPVNTGAQTVALALVWTAIAEVRSVDPI